MLQDSRQPAVETAVVKVAVDVSAASATRPVGRGRSSLEG
jgi:hypothetical protein